VAGGVSQFHGVGSTQLAAIFEVVIDMLVLISAAERWSLSQRSWSAVSRSVDDYILAITFRMDYLSL
jgi:hypothetical protein